MPARPPDPTTTHAEQADLKNLAATLTTHGLHADLHTPADRLPYLLVRNPQATALTERVYAQADSYWYGWAERIAGCDEADAAAAALARVLRTTDSPHPTP